MPLYYPPLPFGFLAPQTTSLVDGSDGDLVILNGQTVQITAGSIKSYNSIDIQLGGILEIVGAEAITQIGCRNSFICNGIFRGRTTQDVGTKSIGADNWLGLPWSHTQSQSAGGRGGPGNQSNGGGGNGGNQVNGHAGGGGGFSNGVTSCVQANGGNGNANGANQNIYYNNGICSAAPATSFGGTGNQGGHGSPGTIANAQTSLAIAISSSYGGNGGGGGGGAGMAESLVIKATTYFSGFSGAGGGARGEHGRHVFILAEKGITGTGIIDFGGGAGYNGGGQIGFHNGGGGGGGAGGAGGAVWIRHFGASVTPTIITSGGAGGSRSPLNTGGVPGYYYTGNPFADAQNGSGGGAGILDVQSI